MLHVTQSVTINRPRNDVYEFWRNLEGLPRFMRHLGAETVAERAGEEPSQQIRDDLRRFKQIVETGEVVRSEASLEGAGQGVQKQRAAQAPEIEVER